MKNSYLKLSCFCCLLCLLVFPKPASCQVSQPLSNARLLNAYRALKAWKQAILSDPMNFTSNWYGPNVCNYTGVYCASALDDPNITTVAGIDLNHGDIAGSLPEELGLLTDLALFHLNTNRFCGTLPQSFCNLHLLYELDLSNNLFTGCFPSVVLSLPSLTYLDLRFNEFEGSVPSALFDLKLDAIFINNNKFRSSIPKNFGNSPVSVIVLANNQLNGCFPSNLAKMEGTLDEINLMNTSLSGCLSQEIGNLTNLTVFEVSFNDLSGPLPEKMGGMKSLEQLDVAHNNLSGEIPASICSLPRLENFTYSYNYFCSEPQSCLKLLDKDDSLNCIPGRPLQRSPQECASFLAHPPSTEAPTPLLFPQSPLPLQSSLPRPALQPCPPPSPHPAFATTAMKSLLGVWDARHGLTK
ncbi:hypothetical protein NE237_015545 [Protea cynaroides]|uniref:Cell wall hydroxyproline-rich glycoprotein n=1 Tax=Protea cynaroides TaxID=273540 RepID=A0A9Q0KEF4_9MAGN|nr:hypothetical protein NE237_015545 [Protea cynaroides]